HPLDPVPQRGVEDLLGAEHVGLDEVGGTGDRPVHVRLGGEVDQHVVTGHRGVQFGSAADVAADEPEPRAVGNRLQVGQVPGGGELVEDGDFGSGEGRVTVVDQLSDVVRADESSTAGNEYTDGHCSPPVTNTR